MKHCLMIGEKAYAVETSNQAIDIDTELDFQIAEVIMKNKEV